CLQVLAYKNPSTNAYIQLKLEYLKGSIVIEYNIIIITKIIPKNASDSTQFFLKHL
ncbi:unnamed protein product, partial [marine sediment metagenome]